ncbi:hypothetical protein AAFF_G00300500 [Aldrovandia affinis]|uniref:Uncharacterized protein n=1 Tax=Aldrovandia affinis TaxID=143900 RepID=A0AAD7SRJ8_9TELE|nr:hypothetical protein AAFF_G00300500 [Aldrovandia affinis]
MNQPQEWLESGTASPGSPDKERGARQPGRDGHSPAPRRGQPVPIKCSSSPSPTGSGNTDASDSLTFARGYVLAWKEEPRSDQRTSPTSGRCNIIDISDDKHESDHGAYPDSWSAGRSDQRTSPTSGRCNIIDISDDKHESDHGAYPDSWSAGRARAKGRPPGGTVSTGPDSTPPPLGAWDTEGPDPNLPPQPGTQWRAWQYTTAPWLLHGHHRHSAHNSLKLIQRPFGPRPAAETERGRVMPQEPQELFL